jgi:hypothetical protein
MISEIVRKDHEQMIEHTPPEHGREPPPIEQAGDVPGGDVSQQDRHDDVDVRERSRGLDPGSHLDLTLDNTI